MNEDELLPDEVEQDYATLVDRDWDEIRYQEFLRRCEEEKC